MLKFLSILTQVNLHFLQFIQWWKEGLVQFLPLAWRQKLQQGYRELWLTCDKKELILMSSIQQKVKHVQTFNLPIESMHLSGTGSMLSAFDRYYLLLPQHNVLTYRLNLPIAAQRNLRQVVGFDLDRLTPYRAEEVYFDAMVTGRTNENKNIQVKLLVVPRPCVDTMLAHIAPLQLPLDGVRVEGDNGVFRLLPTMKTIRTKQVRILQRLWLMVTVVAFIVFLLPLLLMRYEVINRQKALASLTNEVDAVSLRENQLYEMIELNEVVLQRKLAQVPLLQVMDELSRLLPESAYIEYFEYTGNNQITIRGLAKQASPLTGVLSESPLFSEVTQVAPIVPDNRGNERFGFRLTINPPQVLQEATTNSEGEK